MRSISYSILKWTDYLPSNLSMKLIALIYLLIIIFSEIGYCGHPKFPYAHTQLKQANNLIMSYFQEEDYSLNHNTLKNRKTNLVSLYFDYRHKKNEFRTDIMNDDQNAYTFAPNYGDGSTAFRRHMISVVVFYSQIHLKVCWWITQLQRCVALMIIRMLHHVPKKEGKWYYCLYVACCTMYHL